MRITAEIITIPDTQKTPVATIPSTTTDHIQ